MRKGSGAARPAMMLLAALASTILPIATHAAQGTGQSARPGGNPVSIPVTPEQAQAEVALTRRLNREQAEFAARQLAENEAARKAFEQATAERAATIARQQAEYEAQLAAVEAERQRRERAHAEAMEKWRADVAACQAGKISRCGPPQS